MARKKTGQEKNKARKNKTLKVNAWTWRCKKRQDNERHDKAGKGKTK